MAGGLPPPPTRAASGDFQWTAWYNQLYTLLSTTGSVAWSLINFAGSSLSDIQNKAHNLLTSMQGGTTNEYYHLTAAQYAAIGAGTHNSLSGLQGGTASEYYHLTQLQHANTTAIVSAPITKTGNFTVGSGESWYVCNGTGTITVTLPTASTNTGRHITIKTIAAFTVVSASSNVVPLTTATAGTAILAATAGKTATLVSDGTNWIIMMGN
jgi:hypothetical protein